MTVLGFPGPCVHLQVVHHTPTVCTFPVTDFIDWRIYHDFPEGGTTHVEDKAPFSNLHKGRLVVAWDPG